VPVIQDMIGVILISLFFLLYGHIYVLVRCSDVSLLNNKTAISQPEIPEVLTLECNLFNIITLRCETKFSIYRHLSRIQPYRKPGHGRIFMSIAIIY
jgi:hypothetical protein